VVILNDVLFVLKSANLWSKKLAKVKINCVALFIDYVEGLSVRDVRIYLAWSYRLCICLLAFMVCGAKYLVQRLAGCNWI
jgi:hypothetical protein